jgi:hypothetical protein
VIGRNSIVTGDGNNQQSQKMYCNTLERILSQNYEELSIAVRSLFAKIHNCVRINSEKRDIFLDNTKVKVTVVLHPW